MQTGALSQNLCQCQASFKTNVFQDERRPHDQTESVFIQLFGFLGKRNAPVPNLEVSQSRERELRSAAE